MEGGDVCTSCGACCAALRVGFSEDETTRRGGLVPWPLTEPWIPEHRRMRGTAQVPPRCVALEGQVGRDTRCMIYGSRPSPCAALEPGSDGCLHARAAHGLPPTR